MRYARFGCFRAGIAPAYLVDAALADRPWSRMRGLLGRPAPHPGCGLLISPCGSVHTLGMAYPIDVVFLDPSSGGLRVLHVEHRVPAGRFRVHARGASVVMEFADGEAARIGVAEGDRFVRLD